MGEYTPLFWSLGIIFLLGGFVPMFMSGFVDVSSPSPSSIVAPLSDRIDDGVKFFGFSFNPFNLLGSTLKSFFVKQVNSLSYVPNFLLFPLLIICILGFAYTLIKLLPTT